MKITEQNIEEIKSNLHYYIDNIDDTNLLKAVYVLLTPKIKREKDDWFDLDEELKFEIEKSIAEADKGEFISHKDAMKEIYKKVNSL